MIERCCITDYPKGHQCRYCAFCFEGDCFYCGELERVLSEKSIRRENRCARFAVSELGSVETGKMYHPRRMSEKPIVNAAQCSFFDAETGENG